MKKKSIGRVPVVAGIRRAADSGKPEVEKCIRFSSAQDMIPPAYGYAECRDDSKQTGLSPMQKYWPPHDRFLRVGRELAAVLRG
jgi:hypothetical protein